MAAISPVLARSGGHSWVHPPGSPSSEPRPREEAKQANDELMGELTWAAVARPEDAKRVKDDLRERGLSDPAFRLVTKS
jgi:hypothetical protein